ncbi:hypothetical protein [Patulibacter defluvii]|uniref:hypothetical protein n=1 Tax=Patulibacter defluvii TaxID=3095358 RepID=UPI002A75DE21|nr:hypothetical protein [Patulibacter sp. DM4]
MSRTNLHRITAIAAAASLSLTLGAATGQAAVKGSSIKRGSIPANRIKPNSLTGAQIDELKLGPVTLARSAERAATAAAADDAKKLNGRDQTAFLANTVRMVFKESAPIVGSTGGTPADVTASCGPNEKAIGGGGAWIIPNFQDNNQPSALHLLISGSMPDPAVPDPNGATGWRVLGRNLENGLTRVLRAYVTCVPKTA